MTRTSLETIKYFEKREVGVPMREGTARWMFDHIRSRGREGGLVKSNFGRHFLSAGEFFMYKLIIH